MAQNMGGGRQSREFYNRPLTPEEAQFATDNINVVWWYLDKRGLDRNEWVDVVIFRYLLSVKRYLSISELQQYKFVNIACKAMQSAIGGEYAKRERRPQTISLNAVIHGTEDMTLEQILADPVTVEDLVFARK